MSDLVISVANLKVKLYCYYCERDEPDEYKEDTISWDNFIRKHATCLCQSCGETMKVSCILHPPYPAPQSNHI